MSTCADKGRLYPGTVPELGTYEDAPVQLLFSRLIFLQVGSLFPGGQGYSLSDLMLRKYTL